MRRFLILLVFLASESGLSVCGSAPADWTYTPLENFDPAQVSMLPANPYREPLGAAGFIATQPRASTVPIAR